MSTIHTSTFMPTVRGTVIRMIMPIRMRMMSIMMIAEIHDQAHLHDHHEHDHVQGLGGGVQAIEKRILAKNDALAGKNRAWLSGREIFAVNLVSAPGSGKTTLLERTIPGGSPMTCLCSSSRGTRPAPTTVNAFAMLVRRLCRSIPAPAVIPMPRWLLADFPNQARAGQHRLHRKCRQSRLPGAFRSRRAGQGSDLFRHRGWKISH